MTNTQLEGLLKLLQKYKVTQFEKKDVKITLIPEFPVSKESQGVQGFVDETYRPQFVTMWDGENKK